MFEIIFTVVHVACGSIGILTGFSALLSRKGSYFHRLAGNVFSMSMLFNGATASVLGHLHDDVGDVFGGLMTLYFISTAWFAAKRKDGQIGKFEKWVVFVPLLLVCVNLYFVYVATTSNDGKYLGFPAAQYWVVASIMTLALAFDIRLIIRKGLRGHQRIARHLWRMCMGVFIASGSFFLGQMQIFPEPIRKIEILFIPILLVIILMVFWLLRVNLKK